MSELGFITSPAIKGKYEVVNTHLPILHSKIGEVDFRKITLDQADRLYALGTRYLKNITSKKTNKKGGS